MKIRAPIIDLSGNGNDGITNGATWSDDVQMLLAQDIG